MVRPTSGNTEEEEVFVLLCAVIVLLYSLKGANVNYDNFLSGKKIYIYIMLSNNIVYFVPNSLFVLKPVPHKATYGSLSTGEQRLAT